MPRNITITFNDGTQHAYQNVPDEVTPEQVQSRAATEFAGKAVTAIDGGKAQGEQATDANLAEMRKYGFNGSKEELQQQMNQHSSRDIGDAAYAPILNIGSSMIATPVAGLAGLVQGAKNLFSPGMEAGSRVRQVQDAMTYEPKSRGGQAVTNAVTYPLQKLSQFADYAGTATNDATGSPALATGVNTAIQMVPAMLLKGRGGVKAVAENPAVIADRAENYVRNNTGVDWDSLSLANKARIKEIAKDAKTLDALDPKALERQLQLESLPKPVPATQGMLTRDPVQLRNEGNVSATEGGKAIRDIHVAGNKALLDNLEILKGKTGGKAASQEQTGASIQDAARAKLDLKKKEVSDLYSKAEAAGELQAPVSPKPIIKVLTDSPDKTHLGWVESWLNKTDGITKTDSATIIKKYSLKELEDLRQAAVAKAMNGGTDGYYAGKVIKAIDTATESAGGEAYKAARAARKAQAMEFEDQGGVAKLVDNKSRTDRATALEDTWRKTVLGGSIDDLRNVKKSLLTGGDTTTRIAGKQAWKDIRAQTIQHITDEATKSVTRYEDGSPNVTPASMERAIKSIGPDKLNEIFGPGTVAQINKIMEATRTIKTEPPTGFKGSPTFANVIAYLEKGVGKIPVIGDTATGVVRAAAKINDLGKTGRETRAAQKSPLDIAEQKTGNALARKRNANALRIGLAADTPREK